jgi:hypothetical protein
LNTTGKILLTELFNMKKEGESMQSYEAACPPWTAVYKDNWAESFKRVMAWWRNEETDRPVLFNAVPRPQQRGRRIHPKDAAEAARFDLDAEVCLHNARYDLENTLYLAESAPAVRCGFASTLGLPCVQAGGSIQYAPDTFNAWLEQEENLYARPLPEPGEPCPELAFVLGMIRRFHETFGYDVILGANPMLDPLTTLSMMRGTEKLCMDMIDQPDTVKRWAGRLGEFHRQAVSSYRSVRAACGRREDVNWCGAWAPGDMDAIQCDVSVMLSPEMFREFALPEVEYEASFYDYTIWHLDGTGEFKHLDDILAIPNLHAIQYVDEMRRDPIEFAEVWEKILRRGKSIIFNCDYHYAPALTKRLGSRGLAFGAGNCNSESCLEQLIKDITAVSR